MNGVVFRKESVLGFGLAAALALVIGCGGGGGGGTVGPGGTDGGTDGGGGGIPTTPGVLPADVILYSIQTDTGNLQIRSVKADGTGDALYANLPAPAGGPIVSAFAPSPIDTAKKFFASQATDTAPIGIYLNSTATAAGATVLVAPKYVFVSNLMVAQDGKSLFFIAQEGENPRSLYRMALEPVGEPTLIDAADQAAMNFAGTELVYSKLVGDKGDLFRRSVTGTSSTNLTNSSDQDETYPAFSRDGQNIVFSSGPTFLESDLFTMKRDGTARTRLTTTTDEIEAGASYNETGNQVAYTIVNLSDPAKSGLYRLNLGTPPTRVELKLNPTMGSDLYWTTTKGRSRNFQPYTLDVNAVTRRRTK